MGALVSAAAACAQSVPRAPDPPQPAGVMVDIVLPQAQSNQNALRVTLMPSLRSESSPTVQATLHIEGQPGSAVRLPPWTLFPADQASTFVVRVPAQLVAASRAGQRLILRASTTSASAGASSIPAAPVDVQVRWSSLHE